MHGCKPHEKIVTMHDFSLVRIAPGNIVGISAAGTGLIYTCAFIFCDASVSPAGGSKIDLTSHHKPRDDEQYLVKSAGKSSQKEDFHLTLPLNGDLCRGIDNWAVWDGRERTKGWALKDYLLLWVRNWAWGLVDNHFETIFWVYPMHFKRHFLKCISRQIKYSSSRRS